MGVLAASAASELNLAEPKAAPTLDDARRAADVLVEAGAAQVLLYGSLARGDATVRSDVDLMAIFPDLGDYSERLAMQKELTLAATKAAGRACDVHVSDLWEWKWRVEHVSASFEHDISADCVCVRENPKSISDPVPKPIGRPTSNVAEAVSYLNDWALPALLAMERSAEPNSLEAQDELEQVDERRTQVFRGERHVDICKQASTAVKHSLTALMIAGGRRPPQPKRVSESTDDICAALVALAEPTRSLLTRAVTSGGVAPGELSKWLDDEIYIERLEPRRQEALATADACVLTAMTVGYVTLDELARRGAAPAELTRFRRMTHRLWKNYAETSTFDGKPRAVPLEDRPWEAVA